MAVAEYKFGLDFFADAWDERTLLIATVTNAKYTIDLRIKASLIRMVVLVVCKISSEISLSQPAKFGYAIAKALQRPLPDDEIVARGEAKEEQVRAA